MQVTGSLKFEVDFKTFSKSKLAFLQQILGKHIMVSVNFCRLQYLAKCLYMTAYLTSTVDQFPECY